MRNILLLLLVISATTVQAQNLFTSGDCHTSGQPTINPGARGCRTVLDTSTMHYWIWKIGTTWTKQEKAPDVIVGCSAPLYTPTKHQSDWAVNACDSLYHYRSSAWRHMNPAGGSTYTAGTGIDITGTVISNTAPDQTASLTGAGINAVTGTYPNFTVTGTEVDGSITNEIQNIDTLSLSGSTLSASLLNDGLPAKTVDLSGLTPSTEAVQDITGAMVSGNTETLISVTYDDPNGKLDFAVTPTLSSYTNDAGFLTSAVTSVGLDLPAEFVEAGTPVTTSGTLSATWAAQAANLVFRSGNAGGTPSFTALTAADIPAGVKLWTNNSTTDYLTTTTNSVGIGTTSASAALHALRTSEQLRLGYDASNYASFTASNLGYLTINPTGNRVTFGNASDVTLFTGGGNLYIQPTGSGKAVGIKTAASSAGNLELNFNNSGTGSLIWYGGGSTPFVTFKNTGLVGIGTTSPDRLLHTEVADAATNAVTYTDRLTHTTSGTATTGFGAGTEVELENGSGTNRVAMTEEITWSDAVDATEDATWKLNLIRAGTLTTALTVASTGQLTGANGIIGSYLEASTGSSLGWVARSVMTSPANGVIRLANNAGTDFDRLQFGGTTSAFPSWQRSGAGFISRLADDSGNATITAASITSTGTLASTRNTATLAAAATTLAITRNVTTVTGDAGGNVLATITGGQSGQILTLIFVDALVTITDDGTATANTVNLSAAFTSTANDTLTLVFDGTSWRECFRSTN